MAASIVLPATALHLRRVHAWVNGGLVAAGLVLLFLVGYWALRTGASPLRVMQGITAAVFGPASYAGGGATALIGLCLLVASMLAVAACYVRACGWLPLLRTSPLRSGVLCGALLYALAHLASLPSWTTAWWRADPLWMVASLAASIALVGLPIAWFARRG